MTDYNDYADELAGHMRTYSASDISKAYNAGRDDGRGMLTIEDDRYHTKGLHPADIKQRSLGRLGLLGK